MSILQRVMAGLGDYFIAEGKAQLEDRQEQIKMDREIALKQLEFQHDDANTATQHTNKLEELDVDARNQGKLAVAKAVIEDRLESNKANRTLSHDITIKGIDFADTAKLDGLRHKYKLSEDQFSSVLDANKAAAAAGTTVDRVVFSKDGQMQLVYKNGDIVSKGPKGAYNPGGTGTDSLGDLLNPNGGASGPSGATSTSGAGISLGASQARTQGIAPAPQGNKAAALAQAGNAYAAASQNPAAYRSKYPSMFDAQGNLLPQEQVIAQVNQAYGGQ